MFRRKSTIASQSWGPAPTMTFFGPASFIICQFQEFKAEGDPVIGSDSSKYISCEHHPHVQTLLPSIRTLIASR
jgi:hypothetical protein